MTSKLITALSGVDEKNLQDVAHSKSCQDEQRCEGFSLSNAPSKMRIKFFALVSVMCYLLFGCDNVLQLPKDTSDAIPAGYGRVAVTVTGAARTVFPEMPVFEKIEYAFAKVIEGEVGEAEAQEPEEGSAYFALELGDWQVTVTAYAKEDDTKPAGMGTSDTFTVDSTTIETVEVKLVGNVEDGAEGTFSYHIEYPDGAEITVFSLKNLLDDDAELIELTPIDEEDDAIPISIPAGIYWLTIQLELDNKIIGANEAVYIYNGVDSEYRAAFTVDNFSRPIYIITGGGTEFTATRGVMPIVNGTGTIQEAVDAIRTDVNGDAVTIQFGNSTSVLNIGTESAQFSNAGETWGEITLTGKITSQNNTYSQGTVNIANGVSVTSTADIANTVQGGNNSHAVNNAGNGTVNISGGTVSARTGYAVLNRSSGAVTISGGTVSATDTAVFNSSSGAVTISGGTVSAPSYAVSNSSTTGQLTLSGSPNITGRIYLPAAARLYVSAFNPEGRVYTLDFAAYTTGGVAIIGGAAFLDNFRLYFRPTWGLAVSGGNLVFVPVIPPPIDYVITGSGTSFTATRDGETVGTANQSIQNVINAIQTDASGVDANIQFGSGGSDVLDIGTAYVQFETTWGAITLSGKITSGNNANATVGASFYFTAGSITSMADIANTGNGSAVNNISERTVTISGGTVSAAGTGNAVNNNRTGTVTISGDTVLSSTSGTAVYNNSTGTITLDGNPEITGPLYQNNVDGILNVTDSFAPAAGRKYTLSFPSYSTGRLAVRGGADFLEHFELPAAQSASWELAASGNNVMVKAVGATLVPDGTVYTISGEGTTFTATKDSVTVGTANQPIQTVINAIRTDAPGANIVIHFDELDIGTASAQFNNTGGNWGGITLTGNITSSVDNGRTVQIDGTASVYSTADIANTGTNVGNSIAIYWNSSGVLTISGGTVSATAGRAVSSNSSNGSIIVTGTALVTSENTNTDSATIFNNNTGSITISGGTVQNTATNTGNSYVVNNSSTGSVTVTGTALVTSTNANSRVIYSTNVGGLITITGGTVSAAEGSMAVYPSGTTTLGGDPTITGAIYRNAAAVLNLTGTPAFNPSSDKVYTLRYYTAPAVDTVAVTGGAPFIDNFALDSSLTTVKLAESGDDLVIAAVE